MVKKSVYKRLLRLTVLVCVYTVCIYNAFLRKERPVRPLTLISTTCTLAIEPFSSLLGEAVSLFSSAIRGYLSRCSRFSRRKKTRPRGFDIIQLSTRILIRVYLPLNDFFMRRPRLDKVLGSSRFLLTD